METTEAAVSLTRKLLSFNTINPPGEERDCAHYLGKLLERGGFEVSFHEFADKRTSLVARLDGVGNKDNICFSGHTDTVPLGNADWSRDPFGGESEGDKIYGRGSSDMKGGLAAMVEAALAVAKSPRRSAGITLVITAGEETGCQGAYHVAQMGYALGRVGALLVGEPTANYPLVGHKGALWLEARTTGVTAHGSMPEQGVNAIYKAAQALVKLQSYQFGVAPHPLLGSPTLNVGTISGGSNINIVPDQAAVGIDIRTIPGQKNKFIYENLQSYLGEEVGIKQLVDAASVLTDPGHEWVQEVFDIMKTFLKERPEPKGATYFTDASALKPAFGDPPTIVLGPGEPTMAHKIDEFCCISKIKKATEAYMEIAKRWCLS